MLPDGIQRGKWTDTSCKKKNIVVCPKMQDWTMARLLKEFLDSKKQYEKEIFQLKNTINNLQNNSAKFENELNEVRQSSSIPVGFIYVQLPNQSEPTSIWSKLKWQEVTSQYANMFFRVNGNMTEAFGQNQEESAPRLSKVNITSAASYLGTYNKQDIIASGKWSQLLYTGLYGVTGANQFHFQHINSYVSNDEVRPKNTAIKIWKRIQ